MTKLQAGELYEKIQILLAFLNEDVYYFPSKESLRKTLYTKVSEILTDYRDTFNIVKAFDLYHALNEEE